MDNSELLPPDIVERFLRELIASTSLSENQMQDALSAFVGLWVDEAILTGWRAGEISLEWSVKDHDFIVSLTN